MIDIEVNIKDLDNPLLTEGDFTVGLIITSKASIFINTDDVLEASWKKK